MESKPLEAFHMQTLISVFDDRAGARKAVDRLVRKNGFARDNVHLHESDEVHMRADEEGVRELADHTMGTAEREVAVDRGVLESLGRFFVSLFGDDRGTRAAGEYGNQLRRGSSVVIVDAADDEQAEIAAITLHDCGAADVEDRHTAGGTPVQPGVRMYPREAPTLSESAQQRQLRDESLLADRAGQVSRQMKEDREERAYASAMNHTDRDRPK
jgi:hypothetical protein